MDYIFDQTAGEVGRLPFGRSNVRRSGCGAVAVFNALVTLGQQPVLEEIIDTFRHRHGLRLFGFLGISLWSILGWFRRAGYTVRVCADPRQFDRRIRESGAGIFWFLWWNRKNPKHPLGAHFIHVARGEKGFRVYNLHRGQTGPVETDSLRALLKREALWAVLLEIISKN